MFRPNLRYISSYGHAPFTNLIRKVPDSGACLSSSLQTMLVDNKVKIFSFTSGSFSGFKQVARITPMVCRCRTIAEPGKQIFVSFPLGTTPWSTVQLIYGTQFSFVVAEITRLIQWLPTSNTQKSQFHIFHSTKYNDVDQLENLGIYRNRILA